MSASHPSMLARPDTLLGICQAIGEDLGINPTWVRAALACGVFFNLAATVAIYLGLGLVVAVSRWLFPAPSRPIADVVVVDTDAAHAELAAEPIDQGTHAPQPLPLAA
ncbi:MULTISPECIES: PspC domain-containing protein [Sphingobium]|uniref:PspC domain-containing protein n=1 Tax=Sphingobium TaxID=165695 RepID=UPI0015EB7E94|nr:MULTISPECIES: PspC domain-containing protein [Sphingobium]MCW2363189.1 phage shock protein PspC (stress-responsive transcriptional regulator) [Sphingobium sp. B10D3B]MCW2400131.1 phage shock protein PspC (stress-responsive transcriptional regulator) [Sphingobium sp. B10D7B]MCW2407109.1 phage shock protein PspC (stress-responsive transcriptional regulator) [Sphingobium xanthum]